MRTLAGPQTLPLAPAEPQQKPTKKKKVQNTGAALISLSFLLCMFFPVFVLRESWRVARVYLVMGLVRSSSRSS